MPMPHLPTDIDRVPEGMAAPNYAELMRPSTFADQASAATRLAIDPNQPFFLHHHPKAWRVSVDLKRPMALPDVTKFVIAPGVNGVRTRRKNEEPEMQYREAIMKKTMKGWKFLNPAAPIPAGCLPDGVPPGSYIREMPCQGLINLTVGMHYAEAWEIPIQTLPDDPQRFQFDNERYERWLKFLVESGQIAPMIPGILAGMTRRTRDHVERAQGLNLVPAVAEKWIGFRTKILENYEAATPAQRLSPDALAATLAGYLDDGAAAPKKKAKTK